MTSQTPSLHKAQDFRGLTPPDWCPSCGNYAVLNAVEKACAALGLANKDVLCVSGIGCSSNLPGFLNAYGLHGIHGRAIPLATGAKLANPELTVIVVGGDGDGYGIGLGHFIHAMRRNLNLTYLVMNNQIYGLTTGQASPTTMKGVATKSTPFGSIENPVNPMALALASGASFVARAFCGDIAQMADLVAQAIEHKGFSFLDCLSPCVTFNKINTYAWFREKTYKLEDSGHDRADFLAAMARAMESPERFALGVFYQNDGVATYEDQDQTLFQRGSPAKARLALDEDAAEAIRESFR